MAPTHLAPFKTVHTTSAALTAGLPGVMSLGAMPFAIVTHVFAYVVLHSPFAWYPMEVV